MSFSAASEAQRILNRYGPDYLYALGSHAGAFYASVVEKLRAAGLR
jgi:hypothetical protein